VTAYTLITYQTPTAFLCRLGLLPGEVTYSRQVEPSRPLISTIQQRVAEFYGLPVIEMKSARRAREVVRPRQVAMYLARQLTLQSHPVIGQRFGNRDHTTVIHAVRQIGKLIREDAELRREVEYLRAELGG